VRPKPGRGGRIFPRFTVREDVDRELESHIALRAEELVAEGWEPAAAREEAARLLGDTTEIARACVGIVRGHQKAVRRAGMVEAVWQDLRFGLRTLVRSPGFALVAVLTLAMGVGANTAIFSVVQGVLLEPLPYEEPEELVAVWESRSRGGTMSASWANFVDWEELSTTFAGMFAYRAVSTTVLGGAEPVIAQVAAVSHDIWSVLGVRPVLGRLTTPEDHLPGAAATVVVSNVFWQNELAGRELESIVLELYGARARVVGVVADGFDFPAGTQIWAPIDPAGESASRTAHNWYVAGRLAAGLGIERATQEMDALTRRLVAAEPDPDSDFLAVGAVVEPLHEQLVAEARAPLLLLLGAASLVLLVACTNLASTLLARGTSRAGELAVRASLGAGRGRIVRQLLTESLLLALGGSVAGLALAATMVGVLQRLDPGSVPRLEAVGIDGAVLAYTGIVSVLTVALFGLFPALRLAVGETGDALRSGSRGNAASRRGVAWGALVGTEVALALVLLVASGLLVRSFRSLLVVDAGFNAVDVMTAPVALSRIKYATANEHADWYARAAEELEALPEVASAGVMSTLPLGGGLPNGRMELDGDLEKHAVGGYVVASAGALEALDVPLVRGRPFDRTDTPQSPHVAIVSESFAEEFWPGQDPIGRQVTGGGMDDFWQERRFAQVVGVVGDVRFRSLGEDALPTVYFPYSQRPSRLQFGASLVVEAASGSAESVAAGLRATLQRLDPDVPVRLATQESLLGDSLAAREFGMLLLAGFALTALLLAVVGIYGVVSYSVARRTREMGIRLALGSDPAAVMGLVMRSSMRMVAGGLVLGVAAALFATRLMRGMLYEVEPADPVAMTVAVLVLATAAAAASWIPARSGTRVDPMLTMRAE